MNIQNLFTIGIERKASDLHLLSGYHPILRIEGELHTLVTLPKLEAEDIEELIFSFLNATQKELLISNKELDFSARAESKDGVEVRVRGNCYFQKNSLAASFRFIPTKIPTFEELNLPVVLEEFTKLKNGLALLTGATSQGKSTTLASIIETININRKCHIVTIEDPIEYVYSPKKSIISQREMHQDTHSYANALRGVLREDPDIVYIGEMRDKETIASALTIAETGHLVFSTLHTNSAAQTIDRIIDSFPSNQQSQIRMQLSMVIEGVVTQRLIPAVARGRVPVCEILFGEHSIKNTIREGKTHMIDNIIQTSSSSGMVLFENYLKDLVEKNIVSQEVALEYALRPDMYLQLIQR